MANGNDRGDLPGDNTEGVPLDSGRPAVAAAPGKMALVLVVAAAFLFIVVRSLFFSDDKPVEKPVAHTKETVQAATKNPNELSINPAGLPSTPAETPAPPPPPPISIPTPPAPPEPMVHTSKGPSEDELKLRVHSPMVVSGGGLGLKSATSSKSKTPPAVSDSNLAFAQNVASSQSERVEATSIGNLNITIAQGKLVHAVLETAINSDLPGPIRAVVSHDVYGEAGKNILIPKGSRVIGVYNSSVKRGQKRVYIIWTRVIRPDGIDVAIDSPGVDTLGRGGIEGTVDNKYFEMFSTALLTSAFDIGIAKAGDALFGDQQQTQTTGPGGTTTTSSPTTAATTEAVSNIGDVGKSIVGNTLNLQPTINIDQGTPINIYVNKDLVFPSQVTGKSHFVE